MAFDDIPIIGKCYEQIPLTELNSTEAAVINAIASHKNGCYIGQKALALQARTSTGNLQKVLRGLCKKGIVTKEQSFPRINVAQRYFIDIKGLIAFTESVSLKTPSLEGKAFKDLTGIPKDGVGIFEGASAYPVGHPYKNNKNYKNDKDERFSFITKDLPETVRALIKFGNNIKEKLDNLERLGISLEAIKGALEETDFSNAYKVGGLFVEVLNCLIAEAEATTEKTIEQFTPRRCDLCVAKCVYESQNGLTEEKFLLGSRCEFNSESEYRIARERNGF